MAQRFHLQPLYPINDVIEMFTEQAETQLEVNYRTQHVFPHDIYTGFAAVNAYRKALAGGDHNKGWFAEGHGEKSFHGHVINADGDKGVVDILFTFNDYLRYVDIGVGRGTKAGDVQRGRNVRYKSRYTPKWDRKAGRSHRPAIMPEMNHVAQRVQRYLSDYYAFAGETAILKLTEKQTP